MSLRLRFATLFTITVAILLLLSAFTIYYLNSEHRRNEYSSKLKTEARLTFDEFKDKLLKNAIIDKSISEECGDNTLVEKEVYIFSQNFTLLYSYLNANQYQPTAKDFISFQKQKDVYFKINDREYIAIYADASKQYIVVSAIDIDGFNKLNRLKYILLFVSLGCLIVSAIVSYFIAATALKPLSNLNNQIQQTTEQNLSHQVFAGNGKDEVSKIATNYNAMMLRLNKAFDVQKNFVHHASHELRTPLTTMYATTELALNKNLSTQEYKNVLTSLKQEQNNLIELTNSLLLLYQFEKLQYTANFQTLRIDEVVYDSISYCKKSFPGIVIDFSFENVPEENNLIILGNEVLLKSAFNNLIKNAFLYSLNMKLKIILITNETEVQLNFENVGNHLSSSVIANIKSPFSNGENIGIKGIGLGLSIVDRIVNLHKGSFTYFPKTNNINCFSINLFNKKI